MRNYVLTKRDRKILQIWLKIGEEQSGYHTLKTRLTHNFFPISEDIKLISKYLITIEDTLQTEARGKMHYVKTWALEYMKESIPDRISDVSSITDKLNNQTKLLNSALENNPEAIIILDKDFSIIYINDTFIKLSGRSRESISGQVINDNYGGLDYRDYKAHLKTEGNIMSEAPVKIVGSEGRVRWIEFNASVIKQNSEVLAYTATIREITAKNDLELELKALLKKLGGQIINDFIRPIIQ